MYALRKLATFSVVGATIAVMTATIAAAQSETCGVYKYRDSDSGKCVDARDKPSGKPWTEEMLAKKWG